MIENSPRSDSSVAPASPSPEPVAGSRAAGETIRIVNLDPSHLAELIASATDAIVNASGDQRIILFNMAAEKMFGRTAAEVIGQPVRCLIVEGLPQGRPTEEIRVSSPAATVRQTQRLCVLTGLRANGSRFPIEAAVSQIEVGAKSICTAILRDITDRVHALDILRRSEQALADIFAHSPIGLMCVTPDGKIERVNDAQLELFGRPMDEVLGRSVADLHVDRATIDLLRSRLAGGETVHDFHVRTSTGHGLKHLVVDANGVWERGTLVRSRWYVRDVTARIKLESELLKIVESERQRIGQDLHDDVCQQLVAIEFMIGALAARLQAGSPASAEEAHRVSFHLRAAIDRVRELARGLAPSLPNQPEGLMTALQELADRTTKVFQRECRFECPKPVPSLDQGTALHLLRIAQEAVANAIKHGQARHITIKLFVSGPDIVLGVSDDGNGAAPVSEKHGGMGLRVMQYRSGVIGGTLVIQRAPNRGTSVICTVKAEAAQAGSTQ